MWGIMIGRGARSMELTRQHPKNCGEIGPEEEDDWTLLCPTSLDHPLQSVVDAMERKADPIPDIDCLLPAHSTPREKHFSRRMHVA